MPVESLESRRLFAAGFGTGPSVVVPFVGAGSLQASVEPRQLLTGSDASTYTVTYGSGVGTQIRRVTASGKVDNSFGRKGRLTFAADGVKVALDGQDRLYVLVGRQVTRYDHAGQLDKSYTGDGTTTLGGFVRVNDILIDRQDRLWAIGNRSEAITVADGNTDNTYGVTALTVARVTSDGFYDKKFDGDGIYDDELAGFSVADRRSVGLKLRLLGDGSVIAAGIGGYDSPVAGTEESRHLEFVESVKFGPNGKRDLTYGRRGRAFYYQDVTGDGRLGVNFYAIAPGGAVIVKQSKPDVRYRSISSHGGVDEVTPVTSLPDVSSVTTDRADDYVVAADTTPVPSDLGDAGPSGSVTLTAAATHLAPHAAVNDLRVSRETGSVRFTVHYSDAFGLEWRTIDGDEILVRNAAGQYRTARLFGVNRRADNITTVTAEYRVGNPDGSGAFTRADNGPLTVIARAGGVFNRDDSGNVAATIGTINVKIA